MGKIRGFREQGGQVRKLSELVGYPPFQIPQGPPLETSVQEMLPHFVLEGNQSG